MSGRFLNVYIGSSSFKMVATAGIKLAVTFFSFFLVINVKHQNVYKSLRY